MLVTRQSRTLRFLTGTPFKRLSHKNTDAYGLTSLDYQSGLKAALLLVRTQGPLMLEMGVYPEVAAATASTMIFFTAGSASVVYISFGGVAWDYALAIFVLAVIVTLLGQVPPPAWHAHPEFLCAAICAYLHRCAN
jgi:hypothetical protein